MFTTFIRNSIAYTTTGELFGVGLPRYEGGRFGQASFTEGDTSNLISANQSSVEVDTLGFVALGATLLRDNTQFWTGVASLRITTATGADNEGVRTTSVPVTAHTTHTASVWVRGTGSHVLQLRELNSGESLIGATGVTFVATPTWTRQAVSRTFGATGALAQIQVSSLFPAASLGSTGVESPTSTTYHLDGLQLEARPYATTWQLGGTPRAAEVLTIPTAGVLSPTEGTIEMALPAGRRQWGNFGTGADMQTIMDIGGTGALGCLWHISSSGRPRLQIGTGSGIDSHEHPTILDPTRAYFVAVKWWAGHYALSVFDYMAGMGSTVIKEANHVFAPWANMFVGSIGGANRFLDGTIDDLRISNRARTDQEIADAFASNQPLPVDASTTYLMRMDGTLSSSVTSFQQNTSVSTISSSVHTPMLIHTGLTSVTVAPSAPIHTRLIYVGLTSVQTVLRAQIILPPATPLKSIIAETQSVYRHIKQPLEERTLAIDFSSCGEIAAGETIQSVQVSTSIDSIGVGSRIVGNNVLIRISGGAHGENCILSIVATTNSGHRIESSMLIAVREELALTLAASTGGAPTVITPTITPLGQPFATFVVSDQYVYRYTKPPTEVRTLRIDYQWCGEIVAGETIQSARVTTLAGDVVVNYWIANNAVFVRMSGGTHGQSTIISVLAATNSRHLIEADIFVSVWGE